MIANQSLIPRFNKDFSFNDFIYSYKSIFKKNDFDTGLLNNIFGNRYFFFTNNGRTSLYLILISLNLPKGSKIGVPLYACTAVFDAILKAGHYPYFIDVELNNYTIDPISLEEKVGELSAIIVIHTFGRPADMDKIKSIAKDIPMIEDCAHSFLSEYKGEKTGTLGYASFFSFMKYLSTGGGSLLMLNSNNLKYKIENEMKQLASWNIISEIKHSVSTYGYSLLYHKPWFGLLVCPFGPFVKLEQNTINDFRPYNIKRSDSGILFKKLYQFSEKVNTQRKNSFYLINELKNTTLILPYEKEGTFCNYYLFPVRFEKSIERNAAHKYLRDIGVDTAKLFSRTPFIAKKIYGYKGDCPNSEILADTILTIPNYYTLSKEELIKIKNSLIII